MPPRGIRDLRRPPCLLPSSKKGTTPGRIIVGRIIGQDRKSQRRGSPRKTRKGRERERDRVGEATKDAKDQGKKVAAEWGPGNASQSGKGGRVQAR